MSNETRIGKNGEWVTKLEVERRFLMVGIGQQDLAVILRDSVDLAEEIIQGYLPDLEGVDGNIKGYRIRASRIDGVTTYSATTKKRIEENAETKWESQRQLSAEEFYELWPQTQGRRIEKARYRIPHGEYTLELDMFKKQFEGVFLIEVESSDLSGFIPPPWLLAYGKEVTSTISNRKLATKRMSIPSIVELHALIPPITPKT